MTDYRGNPYNGWAAGIVGLIEAILVPGIGYLFSKSPKTPPQEGGTAKPSSAVLTTQAEPKPKPNPNTKPNLKPSSVMPLGHAEALQRGASAEGEATGVSKEEEKHATIQGPKSRTQELPAHSADPGGKSACCGQGVCEARCAACRNRCYGCRNHPRAGNTLYVAVSLGIYALAPYTLGFILQHMSIVTKEITMDFDGFWANILAAFIGASPLLLFKVVTSLVCRAFEQIVGQTFLNPVNSFLLAFGLRFTFRMFNKLFYLTLVPFRLTWWLAVIFDLVFTLVSLSGVLEQLRLKLVRIYHQRWGKQRALTLNLNPNPNTHYT